MQGFQPKGKPVEGCGEHAWAVYISFQGVSKCRLSIGVIWEMGEASSMPSGAGRWSKVAVPSVVFKHERKR